MELAEQIKKVMEFLYEIVSIENDNDIGGLWVKTHLERSDNGDPLYRAEADKETLVQYNRDARRAVYIILQLTDIIQVQHDALEIADGWRPMGMAISNHVTGTRCPVNAALDLSAPIVKGDV